MAEQEFRDKAFLVVPCGKSIRGNAQYGLYTEPAKRPCKRDSQFIGLYDDKAIKFIGTVKTIVVVTYANEEQRIKVEEGTLTDAQKARLHKMLRTPPSDEFKFREFPHRFYVVDEFIPTNAKKTSRFGLQNIKYLDLSRIIRDYSSSKSYDSRGLAHALNGALWE